jgi:hypothetical protein
MPRETLLVLGGAGLVGRQVCALAASTLRPDRIVVASLFEHEAVEAVAELAAAAPDVVFHAAWGDLFVPTDLAARPRRELQEDPAIRRRLLDVLYGPFEAAYEQNHLVHLVRAWQPTVVVDCVNTATGLSYQDVFDGAQKVRDRLAGDDDAALRVDVEHFLLSQSVPQLVRHVRMVHQATTEVGARVYIKCGTTGTGGMGLDIPYTHSEDRPSRKLLAKTEAAFGHTGLLFLMGRTTGAPIVKEIKPAAMIGFKDVRTIDAIDKNRNGDLFEPTAEVLGGSLTLKADRAGWSTTGKLRVTVVDTGENGVFTRGEFAAITALGQMQFVTPEEIATIIVREIRGATTGQEVIAALDASVLDPSYKAGLLRGAAITSLAEAEAASGMPSVALGKLGPPELSKLLFEAQLLREVYPSLAQIVEAARAPDSMAERVVAHLSDSTVRTVAPSVGIPILLPDGATLLRGPSLNVPEVIGHQTSVQTSDRADVDRWAQKGWIDLRPANLSRWGDRAARMLASHQSARRGSAAANLDTYLGPDLDIGEAVSWIFNNELGAHRVR